MSRTIDPAIKDKAIETLNIIMELELAGVVRYTHYSLMVYGFNRIPIVSWLKANATESLDHAHKALDAAVAAAYGWPDYTPEMPDEEILRRLLALNLERAAQQAPATEPASPVND